MSLSDTWDDLHRRFGHEAVTGPGYDDDAAYDASGKAMADRLESAIGSLSGLDVLDYGCGDGRVARHVFPRCKSLSCADVSDAALARLHEHTTLVGFPCDSLHALPEECRFDLIYSWHVAHHNPRIWTFAFILEAHRRLRPGGRLVFDYCNFWHERYIPILRRKAEQGTWMNDFPHCMLSGSELVHFAVEVVGFRSARVLDDRPTVMQPTIVCEKA